MKTLNESHVLEGIATKDLEQTMGQIVETNTITFNEDELTAEENGHVKSLHIAVGCRSMIISRVLIDNEFALNVCLIVTLSRIGVDDSLLRPNDMMVRAFDGTKTSACGGLI